MSGPTKYSVHLQQTNSKILQKNKKNKKKKDKGPIQSNPICPPLPWAENRNKNLARSAVGNSSHKPLRLSCCRSINWRHYSRHGIIFTTSGRPLTPQSTAPPLSSYCYSSSSSLQALVRENFPTAFENRPQSFLFEPSHKTKKREIHWV